MTEGIIKGTALRIDVVDKRLFQKPKVHDVVPVKDIDKTKGVITIDRSAGGLIGLQDEPLFGGKVEVGIKDDGLPYVTSYESHFLTGTTEVLDARNPKYTTSSMTRKITVEFLGIRVGKDNNL